MEGMQTFGDGSFPYGLGRMVPTDVDGLADGVVKQLELAVTVGLLSDGERLPTEVKLAELLGVSTVTLRQGLSKLRDRGLVETRRGRGGGSYICDSQEQGADRALERLRSASVDDLRDLGDACAAAAGMSARLAAKRGLESEFERLQARADAFVTAESLSARRRADSRFHIEIAVIGQSVRLATAIVPLLGELASLRWDLDNGGSSEKSIADHAKIVQAITERDADSAQTYAQDHFVREARVLVDAHLRVSAH